jgi:hypothetical protein
MRRASFQKSLITLQSMLCFGLLKSSKFNMRCNTDGPREFLLLSLIFRFQRWFGRHDSLLRICVVALAGINTVAVLPAQQADVASPLPAVAASASTADPASDSSSQAVPDAPQTPSAGGQLTSSPQDAQGNSNGQQTKRILGIIPNFRAVSANTKLPPETIKDKFIGATEDSFDYSSIFFPAVIAAYNMDQRTTPEFHEGAAGFARYFWHSAVDQTSENYMVEFVFPTFTHEDARYYTLGHGGFFKRTGYALSRAIITRSDSGGEVFNVSEVFGAGAAAGLSNLYYPAGSRSVGNTGQEWALDVGIDAGVFWFREFWPDINRHIFHNKYSDAPVEK